MSFLITEIFEVACDHDDCDEYHDDPRYFLDGPEAEWAAGRAGWHIREGVHLCPSHRPAKGIPITTPADLAAASC